MVVATQLPISPVILQRVETWLVHRKEYEIESRKQLEAIGGECRRLIRTELVIDSLEHGGLREVQLQNGRRARRRRYTCWAH